MTHFLQTALLSTLFAGSLAHAQDTSTQDIEYQEVDIKAEKRVQVKATFESQWHEYNNLDFRALDETSDQAILDSDDRDGFAFTGLSAEVGVKIDDRAQFVLGTSYRGLWGNDQFGNVNTFGGWLYFTSAYVDLTPFKGDMSPRFRVGRQFFKIGGTPSRDYTFADIVDMVRVDQPLGSVGTLTLVPIDVPSLSSSFDNANFVSFIGQSSVQSFGFRGDHMSRRHGAVLTLDGLLEGLDMRAYGFYTDMGALGTGSDISYNGELGNFSDNDWVANLGVRASYAVGPVTPWLALDGSVGIDRKELVAADVNTNGLAWSGGIHLVTGGEEDDRGVRADLSYYEAMGPAYRPDGLQFSHGYVGMKGQQVGGTLANRFLGWHPSAYVGMFGISDSPQETSRKSGTRVISGRVDYQVVKPFSLAASYWYLQDTGVTSLNPDDLDTIDPPYGYAREAFAAESRLGKVLGHEVDLDANFTITEHVTFRINGAVFLPGAFYAQEIARVAGTALGGQQLSWAANAGLRARF